jgi:hypothetical protein
VTDLGTKSGIDFAEILRWRNGLVTLSDDSGATFKIEEDTTRGGMK